MEGVGSADDMPSRFAGNVGDGPKVLEIFWILPVREGAVFIGLVTDAKKEGSALTMLMPNQRRIGVNNVNAEVQGRRLEPPQKRKRVRTVFTKLTPKCRVNQ